MKAAHQGVAVAALPGLAGGLSLASAAPPSGVNVPPAAIGRDIYGFQRGERGLDGWFLDRLFGRR
jgi:hypothetical protein